MGKSEHVDRWSRVISRLDGLGVTIRKDSFGRIEVPDGPIRRVVVRKGEKILDIAQYGGEEEIPDHVEYGIPDDNLSLAWSNIRQRNSFSWWRFHHWERITILADIESYWTGNDYGLGIINRLNGDATLRVIKGTKIWAHPDIGRWWLSSVESVPSKISWDSYQAIAKHLLAATERAIAA